MAIEHFNFPFAFSTATKHAAVVDQDSIDDVANCVMVALSTEIGTRPEVPTFGVPDQLFELQPLSLDVLINAVEEHENRAELMFTQETNPLDSLRDDIEAIISVRRSSG